MRIIVCIKLVPSVTNVSLDENHNMVRDGVVQIINKADESAIEAALRLRGEDGNVTVVTMGRKSSVDALRSLIARGVDNAVLVCDKEFSGADTLATAKTLAAAIRHLGDYNLILCGRKATDGETGQVPPELSTILNIPFVTNVTDINVDQETVTCCRLLEDGREILSLNTPALISLCEYSYALRFTSIMGLRNAKKASIMTLTRKELGIDSGDCGLKGSPTRVRRVKKQISGLRNVKIIEDIDEGINKINDLIQKISIQE